MEMCPLERFRSIPQEAQLVAVSLKGQRLEASEPGKVLEAVCRVLYKGARKRFCQVMEAHREWDFLGGDWRRMGHAVWLGDSLYLDVGDAWDRVHLARAVEVLEALGGRQVLSVTLVYEVEAFGVKRRVAPQAKAQVATRARSLGQLGEVWDVAKPAVALKRSERKVAPSQKAVTSRAKGRAVSTRKVEGAQEKRVEPVTLRGGVAQRPVVSEAVRRSFEAFFADHWEALCDPFPTVETLDERFGQLGQRWSLKPEQKALFLELFKAWLEGQSRAQEVASAEIVPPPPSCGAGRATELWNAA